MSEAPEWWKMGVTGPTGPECDISTGKPPIQHLVPSIDAQVEFWERAALAALAGYAGTMNAPDDMADRVARLADGLTRNWLRRLQQWSEGGSSV